MRKERRRFTYTTTVEACPNCEGAGVIPVTWWDDDGNFQSEMEACEACKGEGMVEYQFEQDSPIDDNGNEY